MEFTLVYLGALLVPGLIISHLLGIEVARTAVAIALSLTVLVLLLVLARLMGLHAGGFGYLLCGSYLVIAALGIRYWIKNGAPRVGALGLEKVHVIPVVTFVSVGVYAAWAGAYTEVPGDVWWHLSEIKDRLRHSEAGMIGWTEGVEGLFKKRADYLYTITGYFLALTGNQLRSALTPVATANTLLFCVGMYSFALYVFRDLTDRKYMLHTFASASVLFYVAHFGLSVFSYIRYYAFAPTVVNFVVYLSAIACVLAFIRKDKGGYKYLAVAMILGIVAAMVHKQEALFVAVMAAVLLLIESLRVQMRIRRGVPSGEDEGEERRRSRRMLVLLSGVIGVYLAMHVVAFLTIDRHNPLLHGVMADIRHYVPFLKNLYVLRPTHQFYQVITVWGVFVYMLFFFNVRILARSSYILAGMIIPFLTVFNPVFTDFFLRFSWPHVLWRMCYMIPLPLVGGFFLVKGLQKTYEGNSITAKLGALATVVALVGLLLPANTTYFQNPYSKLYTLKPVDASNDHRLWSDLLETLRNRKAALVITDPVTGYVINGLTNHEYLGAKFYGLRAFDVSRGDYSPEEFKTRGGTLVVINKRDGGYSATGELGGHWPGDIMKVSEQYSSAFVEFVRSHRDIFDLIWEKNGISMFIVQGRQGDTS